MSLTKHIYTLTRDFNLEFQKKVPEMKVFTWETWKSLQPEIAMEYFLWIKHIRTETDFKYSPEQRHAFAVANRLASGWKLGEERNNKEKTDPFLIPMSRCPDWMLEWCIGKDLIMKKECLKWNTD